MYRQARIGNLFLTELNKRAHIDVDAFPGSRALVLPHTAERRAQYAAACYLAALLVAAWALAGHRCCGAPYSPCLQRPATVVSPPRRRFREAEKAERQTTEKAARGEACSRSDGRSVQSKRPRSLLRAIGQPARVWVKLVMDMDHAPVAGLSKLRALTAQERTGRASAIALMCPASR
ncbi:hypothetical protein E2562_022711 [Oryza meyeriana var. granulata]|uniref:Uncharacterized protein n=1 Tax=Oryza meyeriana var. granulata TaxID=110450 RepID=A0A6G1DZ17_9ORYZ|nr:hypothetical protein E2562_022711 [Oryza meyeriana var. granulata]